MESLSIINEINSTIKASEFDSNNNLGNYLKSRIPNMNESEMLDDSNISQYFMVNPMNEKTKVGNFSTNGRSVKSKNYTSKPYLNNEDWTMDIPKITSPGDVLSDVSD